MTANVEIGMPEKPKPKHFKEFEDAIPSQEGKIVVITGTTSGTGLVAAQTSLKKGATVAVLNRSIDKAQQALVDFFHKMPEAEERTHFVLCDLQNFESVKKAAQDLIELFKESGIDVLVNNAGVMMLEDKATVDGYDVQMQTNHLSHFMLTKLLFPLLDQCAKEKGDARVVNHSSTARLLPLIPLRAKYFRQNGGKLGGNGKGIVFNGGRWARYHQTKLANSVFTSELKRRLVKSGSSVRTFSAHPGFAATELQLTTQKAGGFNNLRFMRGAQSQEDGAMGLIKGMFAEDVENGALYGPFWLRGKATKRRHGPVNTRRAGRMLWRESEKACGEFNI